MSKASKIYDLPMPDFGGTTLGLRQEQRLILITASIFGRMRKDNSVYLDMKTNSHHLLPPSTSDSQHRRKLPSGEFFLSTVVLCISVLWLISILKKRRQMVVMATVMERKMMMVGCSGEE
ncbi:hypothetical protein LXL04_007380 [Taraxacum kok-saghyz]